MRAILWFLGVVCLILGGTFLLNGSQGWNYGFLFVAGWFVVGIMFVALATILDRLASIELAVNYIMSFPRKRESTRAAAFPSPRFRGVTQECPRAAHSVRGPTGHRAHDKRVAVETNGIIKSPERSDGPAWTRASHPGLGLSVPVGPHRGCRPAFAESTGSAIMVAGRRARYDEER